MAEDGRLIQYHECSEFMTEPSDIAVFGKDYYICDFKGVYLTIWLLGNDYKHVVIRLTILPQCVKIDYWTLLGHSVVVVNQDGQFIRRIGSDQVTCFPNGIDISDAGDVLIGDSHGNQFHVAVYDKDAQLVSQFVCPNVKVSRSVTYTF